MNRQQAGPPKAPAQDAASKPGQPQMSPAAFQPAGNRWLATLAGIAAGLEIAAVLSHFELIGPSASTLGSMLVIALLVFGAFFIWRMLRRPRHAVANDASLRQALEVPMAGRPNAGAEDNV